MISFSRLGTPNPATFSPARRPMVGAWLERRATIGRRRLRTDRPRWVTPTAWDLAVLHPADTLYRTRHTRMEAAPIPRRAEEPAGFIASRRNDPRELTKPNILDSIFLRMAQRSSSQFVSTRKVSTRQRPTLERPQQFERLERLEPVDLRIPIRQRYETVSQYYKPPGCHAERERSICFSDTLRKQILRLRLRMTLRHSLYGLRAR